MRRFFLAVAALAFCAGANAAPLALKPDGDAPVLCFARRYSPEELARQPQQIVSRMSARLSYELSEARPLKLLVDIDLRPGAKPENVNFFGGVCEGSATKLVCKPDYRGMIASYRRGKPTAPVELTISGDAVFLRNLGGMLFFEGDLPDYVLKADRANGTFRLTAAPQADC